MKCPSPSQIHTQMENELQPEALDRRYRCVLVSFDFEVTHLNTEFQPSYQS